MAKRKAIVKELKSIEIEFLNPVFDNNIPEESSEFKWLDIDDAMFKRVLKLKDSEEFIALIKKASDQIGANNYDAALELFENERVSDNIDAEAKVLLAEVNNLLEGHVAAAKDIISIAQSSDPKIKQIFANLDALQDYALTLEDELGFDGDTTSFLASKSAKIKKLTSEIRQDFTSVVVKVLSHGSLTQSAANLELEAIKKSIKARVEEASVELQQHRGNHAKLKIIAANLLIALTGVGLLALLGKAIYTKVKSTKVDSSPLINKYAFFGETASEKKAEDVLGSISDASLAPLVFAAGA